MYTTKQWLIRRLKFHTKGTTRKPQQMMNENNTKNDDKTPKMNESCEQTRNSETNLERTTNIALITR